MFAPQQPENVTQQYNDCKHFDTTSQVHPDLSKFKKTVLLTQLSRIVAHTPSGLNEMIL
jgi:hypothetical protein